MMMLNDGFSQLLYKSDHSVFFILSSFNYFFYIVNMKINSKVFKISIPPDCIKYILGHVVGFVKSSRCL